MFKTFAFLIVFTAAALSLSAQTARRAASFDNFDATVGGVMIHTPTPIAAPAPAVNKNAKPNTAAKTSKVKPIAMQRARIAAVMPSVTMAAGTSLGAYSTGDATIDSYISDSSRRYNIDPLLIYAQMHQESSFKLRAMSYKGARGLMQLMPATAVRFGVTNIYDPKQNIDAGVKYMRWLLNTFGQDVNLALAGYNAGEGAVMKYGRQIPPYRETQDYVRRITGRYSQLRTINVNRIVAPGTTVQIASNTTAQPKTVVAQQQPPTYNLDLSVVRLPNGKIQLATY